LAATAQNAFGGRLHVGRWRNAATTLIGRDPPSAIARPHLGDQAIAVFQIVDQCGGIHRSGELLRTFFLRLATRVRLGSGPAAPGASGAQHEKHEPMAASHRCIAHETPFRISVASLGELPTHQTKSSNGPVHHSGLPNVSASTPMTCNSDTSRLL